MLIARWVAVVVSFLFLPGCQQGELGEILVEDPVHDWGVVSTGALVSHSFLIRNATDQSVRIAQVIPACSCTAAQYESVIPPRSTVPLKLIVDTLRLKMGSSARSTRVLIDAEAGRHVITLEMKGSVDALVSVEPEKMIIEGYEGSQVAGTVTLTRVSDRVCSLELTGTGAGGELRRADNRQWELSLKATVGPSPTSRFLARGQALLTDGEQLPFEVPILVKRLDRVVSTPRRRVVFAPGEREKDIVLEPAEPGIEFEIEGVEVVGLSMGKFSVSKPREAEGVCRVTIRVEGTISTRTRDVVNVSISDPRPRTLRYDIFAGVAEGQ